MKNGFLLLDKPFEWTSFDLVAVTRKKLNTRKVGHTGTLDPLATGLMLLGVGEGTKFLSFHTHDKKCYRAKIKFGFISETFDAEGPIQSTNFSGEISKQKLFETLEGFRGKIKQTPPKFSALKIDGQKLCDLARKGQEVKIPEREVEIFKLEVSDFSWPELELEIECSSGTYIRSIASDLGKRLSCGAYLSGLVRTKIQDLSLEQAISIEKISKKKLLPLDFGLEFPNLEISGKVKERLYFGQRISERDLEKKLEEGFFKLYFNGIFFGIGVFKNGVLKAEKLFFLDRK